MRLKKCPLIGIAVLAILVQINTSLLAQDSATTPTPKPYLFRGNVKTDSINIRTDSSVNSEVICKVNKSETLEVLAELYDWYKVRLPTFAPSYVKKDLVLLNPDNTAVVVKNNVNIRLRPDTSSRILGRVNKNEPVRVLEEKEGWYKIEPVKDSFGWIHKNFVARIEEQKAAALEPVQATEDKIAVTQQNKAQVADDKKITLEGVIRPKVFKRIATHKLITKDNQLYLLKGDREYLSSFTHSNVRVTAKPADTDTAGKVPVLEVEKIEAIN
ncbi:MAG: SH3 domain-containing protein [Candidatus Omnitrophica bacterium]|nr:SH3 domain-containing protein [Candidatus Omnitrophota bacterium]